MVDQDSNEKEISGGAIVVDADLKAQKDLWSVQDKKGVEYYGIGSCNESGQTVETIGGAVAVGCKLQQKNETKVGILHTGQKVVYTFLR